MKKALLYLTCLWSVFAPTAAADPCGMVPPIYAGPTAPITRIGLQQTYVFYKNGIESIVLRPGFEGKVDEFGMLIPFPTPPSIRKVGDDVFSHLAAAADPPEVVMHVNQWTGREMFLGAAMKARASNLAVVSEAREDVTVLREEAVGMYEVAVLEAGSARALKAWMDDHGFRYPDGMDDVCEEYVQSGWCFVAVKTRVGHKGQSDPRPGMRSVDNSLPAGASFDGHVQAMGFRFKSDELVVPMRLSAFNPGELRNVVYCLSDEPMRIAQIPTAQVRRQIPGSELYSNLTEPLPLRIIGGDMDDLAEWQKQGLPAQRDPIPHNGIARDVFASDLHAVKTGNLSHELEEREKELLEIGEQLGLRGPELDALHHAALAADRDKLAQEALGDLKDMTLTIIDGDFPREVLAAENLAFVAFNMETGMNAAEHYDAKVNGPAPAGGFIAPGGPTSGNAALLWGGAFALLALAASGVFVARRPRLRHASITATALVAGCVIFGAVSTAQRRVVAGERVALDKCGRLEQVVRSNLPVEERGRAILGLVELGTSQAKGTLVRLANHQDALIQLWSLAGIVALADDPSELSSFGNRVNTYPSLARPMEKALQRFLGAKPLDLEATLLILTPSWKLQQKLAPHLTEHTTELIEVMMSGADQSSRRMAASLLAGQANANSEKREPILAAYTFDSHAEAVPWEGGPLFVPGCSWTKSEAQELFRSLVAWHLFCTNKGRKADLPAIHNNLASWNLANNVGYSMPRTQLTSERWLLELGYALGARELKRVIREQGLERRPRMKALIQLFEALDD